VEKIRDRVERVEKIRDRVERVEKIRNRVERVEKIRDGVHCSSPGTNVLQGTDEIKIRWSIAPMEYHSGTVE
jgi:hypothetical protein